MFRIKSKTMLDDLLRKIFLVKLFLCFMRQIAGTIIQMDYFFCNVVLFMYGEEVPSVDHVGE